MSQGTKIEWAHAGLGRGASWNPIRARDRRTGKIGWHCVHVSEGCRNCYAEAMNRRLGTGLDYKPGHEKDIEIFLDENVLLAPLKWKRPTGIFVCSMSDAFGDFVGDEMLDRMFAVAALCPQHRFLFLTKRPDRMRRYFAGIPEMSNEPAARDALIEGTTQSIYASQHLDDDPSMWLAVHMPLPNVWLGFSAEDQATYRERAWEMRFLRERGWLTFCSYEPALGPLDLSDPSLHPNWLISGGESGVRARPSPKSYFEDVRDQCAAAGVPFFMKQITERGRKVPFEKWPEDLQTRECPR